MWAVQLRVAHTRIVDECGDAVLEDLAGPLAFALKLFPSKRYHVARAGYSAAGAEPASPMRSATDVQAIVPHYSNFPLHSMRKVQETLSHRIHTPVDALESAEGSFALGDLWAALDELEEDQLIEEVVEELLNDVDASN
eukprot:jgi/Tetstr1/430792/TSEL_020577.t1